MEKQFKITEKVKFKVANGTYYGEVSKVTEGGCYITRKDKKGLWLSNDCITKLNPRKTPTSTSCNITKKDIIDMIKEGIKLGVDAKGDVLHLDILRGVGANTIYKDWKESLK